jgi:hypothetical protein
LDVEENIREQEGDVETEPVYDEEERLEGDHGPLLMIHKKCMGYCPGEGVDIKPEITYSSKEIIKERLEGDTGSMLMIRRSCLAPRGVEDDWLCTNVFQSTCTISEKVCRFIVDSGSCENVVSEEVVRKLHMAT